MPDRAGVFTVLGIPGSLRARSYNAALLRAAVDLAPAGMRIDVWEGLEAIPPLNEDVARAGDPAEVAALKEAIAAADALLISTPEYNYGIPGVLKNALDWVSLPPLRSVLTNKAVAIMGASPGILGTARGQFQLRQLFVFTQSYAVLMPEVLVAKAAEKFDDDLRLIDPVAEKLIVRLLENLRDLAGRLA